MNKIIFVFRFLKIREFAFCCIAFISIPSFSDFTSFPEKSPVNSAVVQSPDIFKAFFPCFRLGVNKISEAEICIPLNIVSQENQFIKKFSARSHVLAIPVNAECSDRTSNSANDSRDKANDGFHFSPIIFMVGLLIGVLIFWEIIVPIFY